MKIAIDAVGTPRSGAGLTRLRELAAEAARPGLELLFIVRGEVREALTDWDGLVEYVVAPAALGTTAARLFWQYKLMPTVVSQWGPDVVFAPFNFTATDWPGPRPALAVMVSNLAPFSPVMKRLCPVAERPRSSLLRWFTMHTIRQSDRVFVQSRQALELIEANVLSGRAVVVPHQPPEPPRSPSPPEPAVGEKPYILVVAELLNHKGIEDVIDGLARLPRSRQPNLVVCGRHADRRYASFLQRRAEARAVGDRLRLIGPREHAQVLSLMRNALLCVAPSRFENLSRIPTEAMSVGAPILAADIPSYREACGPGALYFDPERPQELAAHMLTVMSSDSTRASLVAAGAGALTELRMLASGVTLIDELARLVEARHSTQATTLSSDRVHT